MDATTQRLPFPDFIGILATYEGGRSEEEKGSS